MRDGWWRRSPSPIGAGKVTEGPDIGSYADGGEALALAAGWIGDQGLLARLERGSIGGYKRVSDLFSSPLQGVLARE
jgi:hypothetical protein